MSNIIKSYLLARFLSAIKFENSLKAAISTVHDPESCYSIFSKTLSGILPRYGSITLFL